MFGYHTGICDKGMRCVRLKLEALFTGGIGERFYLAVIDETRTIKHHRVDVLLFRTFGDNRTHFCGVLRVGPAASVSLFLG